MAGRNQIFRYIVSMMSPNFSRQTNPPNMKHIEHPCLYSINQQEQLEEQFVVVNYFAQDSEPR